MPVWLLQLLPQLAPLAEQAILDIIKQLGGPVPSASSPPSAQAVQAFADHITKGKPNSPALSPNG